MEDVCARLAGGVARRTHLCLVLEIAWVTNGAACRELDYGPAYWDHLGRILLGNSVERGGACIIARPFGMEATSIFEGSVCVRHSLGAAVEEGQHMAFDSYCYSCCCVLCWVLSLEEKEGLLQDD